MSQRTLSAAVTVVALAVAIAVSLACGSRGIEASAVWEALWRFDPTHADHLTVRELRLPRTVLGVLAGAALAVAGALMQSLTRNPFADPGLLGLNAGAALAVVLGITFAGITSFTGHIWLAFLGAGSAAVTVYAIGARGAAAGAPVRLALAGVALTALLSSITYGILITNESTLNQFRFWVVGSLTGRQATNLTALFVVVAVAIAIGLLAGRSLEAISLGDDAARSLGVRIGATRLAVVVVVTVLAGTATAAAGPLVFVGLAVPHVARAAVGASLPWLLAVSGLGGGALLVVCDVIGRVIAPPSEIAVGVTTAAVGGLLFALLARRMRVVEL